MKKPKTEGYYVSAIVVFLIAVPANVPEAIKSGPFNGWGAFWHWSAVCALAVSTLALVIAVWELRRQNKPGNGS